MNAPPVFTLTRGSLPVLVSFPHVGTWIPPELRGELTPRALAVEDTDWLLPELYDFLPDLAVSTLVASHSRYVIDLNRPPENAPLYAGVNTTGLCPTRHFSGEPIHRADPPSADQVAQRLTRYWHPYHAALAGELARLRALHGWAVLFDAHSIKPELPWLFEGRLPDLNLGTAEGASCAASLRDALNQRLTAQDRYSQVTDGRFKGGYITRHYGRPAEAWHAVQLEMSWSCYLHDDAPPRIDQGAAAQLRPLLRGLIETLTRWAPAA